MIFRTMKWLLLMVFLSVTCYQLQAQVQDNHFMYVQTENNQPFYVRLNGKVFSSTTGGYVILPKLASGDYQLNIGFPKNEYPEEEYHISLNEHNEGFLLKKLDNKWSLLNIESLALIEGSSTAPEMQVKVQSDPFSSMLANVVKDSSLLKENIPVVPTQPKVDSGEKTQTTFTTSDSQKVERTEVLTVIPDQSKENSITETQTTFATSDSEKVEHKKDVAVVPTPEPEPQPEKQDYNQKQSTSVANISVSTNQKPFTRLLVMNEKDGLDLIYLDNKENDTIRLFMPVANLHSTPEQQPRIIYNPEPKDSQSFTITPTVVNPDDFKTKEATAEKPTEEKKLDKIIYSPEDKPIGQDSEKVKSSQVIQSSEVNSDCVNFATDNDFLKLRKRMAAETDNDKMLDVARKIFKNKCFSTEQIRNLSYLFLDDEGRYRFFDLAYAFTSDSNQYNTLQSQLKDPYYINRFKAMIHK